MPAVVNFGRGHRFAADPRCSADQRRPSQCTAVPTDAFNNLVLRGVDRGPSVGVMRAVAAVAGHAVELTRAVELSGFGIAVQGLQRETRWIVVTHTLGELGSGDGCLGS